MKNAYSLLVLIATIGLAHAGGFGGPPPFTNGSPLVSGVNGTYQASVRGSNLSGIIRFAYLAGVQSGSFPSNRWVIFYQGEVFSGVTAAAINDGDISGVLESGFLVPRLTNRSASNSSANGTSNTGNSRIVSTGTAAPFVTTTTSGTTAATSNSTSTGSTITSFVTAPAGFFTAKLDNNSPTGSFKGKGQLAALSQTVNSSTTTDSSTFVGSSSSSTTPAPPGGSSTESTSNTSASSTNPTSTEQEIIKANFKLKGVRVTISAT